MEPTSFNIGTPSDETTSSDGWVLTSVAPAPPRVEPTFTSEEYLGIRTPASVGIGAGYIEGIPEGSTPAFEFSGQVRRQKTVLSLEQAVPPPPRQGMHEKELIAPSTEERARARQTPILESSFLLNLCWSCCSPLPRGRLRHSTHRPPTCNGSRGFTLAPAFLAMYTTS